MCIRASIFFFLHRRTNFLSFCESHANRLAFAFKYDVNDKPFTLIWIRRGDVMEMENLCEVITVAYIMVFREDNGFQIEMHFFFQMRIERSVKFFWTFSSLIESIMLTRFSTDSILSFVINSLSFSIMWYLLFTMRRIVELL